MAVRIFVGFGGTAPGQMTDGICEWHRTRVYVLPEIEGISSRLWEKLANKTCEIRPMFGKDGSRVYADYANHEIVREIGGKRIRIATMVEEG